MIEDTKNTPLERDAAEDFLWDEESNVLQSHAKSLLKNRGSSTNHGRDNVLRERILL